MLSLYEPVDLPASGSFAEGIGTLSPLKVGCSVLAVVGSAGRWQAGVMDLETTRLSWLCSQCLACMKSLLLGKS